MRVQSVGNREVFAPPASYAQERLWFLEQLEPGTALYNIPYIATIKGSVNRAAFTRAVNRLIARHESLRTCFIEAAGKPRQAIHGELSVDVDWEELGGVDGRTSAAKLQAICTEVTSTPFDLRKAPLFRIKVVSLPRETAIITTLHHIISDGWSLGVFQRELSALYQEELGGRPAVLPELRIQYADFAAWQREQLEGEGLDRLRQYWLQQLQGATTILEIPGDYPRPFKQTFSGDVHLFDLDAELSAAIRALANQHGATLFMTLFAAFAVLLYRITGHEDILVGTPIAGRKTAQVENVIGLFVNTLVLRAQLEPELSFVDLLVQAKKTIIEAFDHQDMPFEKLVLDLNPKRDLSHSPLIQVLFTLQNIPALQEVLAQVPDADATTSQSLDGHTGTAKFDFAFFVSEVRDKLQCSVEFNTDLFSLATIEEIGGYYEALLRAIVKSPEAGVVTYPLMSGAKRQQCLDLGKGTSRAYSVNKGCRHLFEEQAARTPDAVAVSHHQSITYKDLNARANRIAHYLIARGVQPGDKVAICIPRSVQQIAALLAIVKAGAAYVPLDPEYPQERLQYILGDAAVRLVLTTADSRLRLDSSDRTVLLDEVAPEIDTHSADNPGGEFSAEMPLYVIHTSGSTGRPKGVVMPHRPLVNLVEWQARESKSNRGAVTLQFASLNFDVASQEIWSTLTFGGCLQLVDEPVRREPPRLLDLVKKQRVARLFLPPVALEQLADAASSRNVTLDDLSEVIVAGDRLQVTDSVRAMFERAPNARLVNQYGPTETHVVTAHRLEGPPSEWPAHPPIGKSIDNVHVYVLDKNREPVPRRVPGELYLGGVSVALGYLNLPEETAKRFIDNPFGEGRLYRTGDVCRFDDDGSLIFLGRADQQIKLRGFRIEPGEVEVVLKRHPAVREAVVLKRQSKQGEDQLAAYLVADGNPAPDKTELRSFLTDKLPAYMIPTHFIALEEFPLTGSGKIDRMRLPEPAEREAQPDKEAVYVAPRTEVERFLADCWCAVLQCKKVSIHDNFFDLGGHSLSATQVVSRVRDEFGIEVPLYRIFERPTVELLALEILQRQAAQEEESQLEALLNELESLSEEDSRELLSQTGSIDHQPER